MLATRSFHIAAFYTVQKTWYIRTSDKIFIRSFGNQSPPVQTAKILHDAGKMCKLNSGSLPVFSKLKLHPLLY